MLRIYFDAILEQFPTVPACLTCSFQAEDMIVLSFLRQRLPNVPVLFLETGYHFADTYWFRDRGRQRLEVESGKRGAANDRAATRRGIWDLVPT